MVDVDDLVSRDGLAEHFEVSPQMVGKWAADPSFPAPVKQLGRQFVYLLSEVRPWRKERAATTRERHSAALKGNRNAAKDMLPRCSWISSCGRFRQVLDNGKIAPFCAEHMKVWEAPTLQEDGE